MELRQLRNFLAVAETGNISRAAQKIFLTQPALSRQIKALEDEIGQCLLERQAHSIRLTPMGEALLREARELLQHADEMLERVRAAGQSVQLRVGYAPSLASGLLSGAVANFSQKHPNARVELFDLSTKEMLMGLENDTLDVAHPCFASADDREGTQASSVLTDASGGMAMLHQAAHAGVSPALQWEVRRFDEPDSGCAEKSHRRGWRGVEPNSLLVVALPPTSPHAWRGSIRRNVASAVHPRSLTNRKKNLNEALPVRW